MAGSVHVVRVYAGGGVARYELTWTADASGDVSGNTFTLPDSYLTRIDYVPVSGAAGYDVTLLDTDGIDLSNGEGMNRSATDASLYQWIPPLYCGGALDLVIDEAGDSTTGIVYLWARELAPWSLSVEAPAAAEPEGTLLRGVPYDVTFSGLQARLGSHIPIAYTEFDLEKTDTTIDTYRWSDRPVSDSVTYGGYKDPRVLSWGTVRRALSTWTGEYEPAHASLGLDDTDGVIKTLLDADATRYWLAREIRTKLYSDADRRAGNVPQTVMRGYINTQPSRDSEHGWRVDADDVLTTKLGGGMLFTDVMLPKRAISATQFPTCPTEHIGKPEPILYGTYYDSGAGIGVVPCRYVGTESLTRLDLGATYTFLRMLVCGHQCMSIDNVYINGHEYPYNQMDVLAPGQTHWADYFATDYLTIAGRDYTIIYVNEALFLSEDLKSGNAVMRVNLTGIGYTADDWRWGLHMPSYHEAGSIEEITNQFLHWLTNFVLNDWQTGAWLTVPKWSDSVEQVNIQTFVQAGVDLFARGGHDYYGRAAIGLDEFQSVAELIRRWCVSADVQIGFNKAGQIVIHTDDSDTSVATVTEQDDIIDGSFELWEDTDALANKVLVSYLPPLVENSEETWSSVAKTHAVSIAGYKLTRTADEAQAYYLRWITNAESVADYRLRRTALVPVRCRFRTHLGALSAYDIGSVISVTHSQGIGAAGWVARKVRVEAMELDLDAMQVIVEGTDRDGYTGIVESSAATFKAPGPVAIPVRTVFPYVRYFLTSDQVIPASVYTSIVWDACYYAEGGFSWTPGTPITFPLSGVVIVGAQITWRSDSSGQRWLRIQSIGDLNQYGEVNQMPLNVYGTKHQCHTMIRVVAGDTCSVDVWQDSTNSGPTLNVQGAQASDVTCVWIVYQVVLGSHR